MLNTTLCYLERGGEYLLLHRVKKEHDLNRDKWIGVGGKFLEGETPEECVLRETLEETGLTLTDYRYRGVVTFLSDRWEGEYMHLFTAGGWTGEQTQCAEGDLEWMDKSALRRLPMWRGDAIFLDLLETNAPFFSLKLRYEDETLAEAALNGRPLPPEISLLPLSEEHLDGVAALWSDPAVLRYTAIEHPLSREESAARLRALEGELSFAVLEEGRFVGIAGCLPMPGAAGEYGLYYQLAPAVWGRRVGTMAARAALAALLRRAPETVVRAEAVAENPASARILRALGFRRTGVRHGAFRRDGRELDIWDYQYGGDEEA